MVKLLRQAEISFIIISKTSPFVKKNICIFLALFGNITYEVVFMKFLARSGYFILGGSAYIGLEYLWRGHSDPSMFFAGGTCFLLLGGLNQAQPRLPLPLRAIAGAGIITAVELLTGLLVNRNYTVWDYRQLPMNLGGQICLPYSLLWIPVSAGALLLHGQLTKLIPKQEH